MGVMTFEMMTGPMPFGGATVIKIAIATVNQPVPSAARINPILPDELDEVLSLALAKDPGRRPSSVRQLVEMLGRVPQRRSTATPVPAPQPNVARPPDTPPAADPAIQATRIPGAGATASPTVAILEQMGLPRLLPRQTACIDWYFASAVQSAREVAAAVWPSIAEGVGVNELTSADPPSGDGRTYPLAMLGAITTAFESSFGTEATPRLREWGRRTTERALAARKSSVAEQRALRLVPSKRRLGLLLKAYLESMDEVRGEPAHSWRALDPKRYWIVHYLNAFALGRRRVEKSCHFWIGAYESMLRWSGLANDWLVEEIECGCVTGTADCVFALRSVKA
jgi:hypothetical protein